MPVSAKVSPDHIWSGDTSRLSLVLERRDALGSVVAFGSLVVKLALTGIGEAPEDTDWQVVSVLESTPYAGSRTQYTLDATLTPGDVPGAGTLEPGREYLVWLLVLDGALEQRLVAGIVLAR